MPTSWSLYTKVKNNIVSGVSMGECVDYLQAEVE